PPRPSWPTSRRRPPRPRPAATTWVAWADSDPARRLTGSDRPAPARPEGRHLSEVPPLGVFPPGTPVAGPGTVPAPQAPRRGAPVMRPAARLGAPTPWRSAGVRRAEAHTQI